MALRITCPACAASFTPADDLRGKKAPCPKCGQTLVVASGGVAKRNEQRGTASTSREPAHSRNRLWLLLVAPLLLLPLLPGGLGLYLFMRGDPAAPKQVAGKEVQPREGIDPQRPDPIDPLKQVADKEVQPPSPAPSHRQPANVLDSTQHEERDPGAGTKSLPLKEPSKATEDKPDTTSPETARPKRPLLDLKVKLLGTVYQIRPPATTLVESVAFSPNSKILASAGQNNSILLWDTKTGRELAAFKGDPFREIYFVHSVAFSADGNTLAWAGGLGEGAGNITLVDMATRRERGTLTGHIKQVSSIAFSPDSKMLASGSGDNTIKIWEVATGKEQATLTGHPNRVKSVAYSPGGKTLASADEDGLIKLWDVTTGKEQATLKGHGAKVHSVVFSPDGKSLASVSDDETCRLWDVTTRKTHAVIKLGTPTRAVAFSPDGRALAFGCEDFTVKLWDVDNLKELTVLRGHTVTVFSVAFRPDGKTLASSSGDGKIQEWDLEIGK